MGFSADWLSLREPADHAARDDALLRQAARAAVRAAGDAAPVIVDLGCGTGSTVRAMAAHLPADTRWRFVDNDAALLELAVARTGAGASAHRVDLADLAGLPLEGAHLVTASALFDLMPQAFVAALAARLAAAGVGLYAALSYDGVMEWAPPLPEDAAVTAAFNRHQRGDKGLGPALGPDAGAITAEAFAAAGFAVRTAPSPWRLEADAAALQAELCDGIARAAAEAGFPGAARWGAARCAAARSTACVIGHLDVLALPRG
jgi:SAM-dependent methyltransferase